MPTNSSIYAVRVVDIHGTAFAEFVNATIEGITWELNGFGGASFSIPTDDPSATQLRDAGGWFREVQIWRDPLDGSQPKLIFWGPIVRARADGKLVQCQAMGLLWYLSRLFFGPIIGEKMTNGDFELGLANWTASGTTASIDTVIVRRGKQALKLVQANQGTDTYAFQTFSYTAGSVIPDEIFVAASFYQVATATTNYIGPAFEQRGLYVKVTDGAAVSEVWTPLSNGAPRNTWGRIYAPPVSVLAGHTATIEVRLYSPGGEIHWDMVTARLEESTGADSLSPVDLNHVLTLVVNYAQSAAAHKPALNITAPVGVFGTNLFRVYQFYDLGNIWDVCFKELVASGVCDIDIVWNATGTTRTLATYAQKGSVKPQLTLELGTNVVDFSYDQDGQATAGAIVVVPKNDHDEPSLGTVQPACRFLGYAFDAAANSGITLGAVETAPIETLPDGVDLKAAAELSRLKALVTVPTLVVKENLPGSVIGVLQVGDTVPVIINYGFVQENTTRRVTAMTLTPNSETLAVTCGVIPPGTGTMLSNLPPTPQAQIGVVNVAVANVDRSRVQPPPNFAQVGGTNLGQITNAQVPTYDYASGNLIARNPYDIIFDLPGAVTTSTSPQVVVRDTMAVVGLSADLVTTGSTATVVNLLKNGAVVATVTVPAASHYANVVISPAVVFVARTDSYRIRVSSAGTGAADLAGGIELG